MILHTYLPMGMYRPHAQYRTVKGAAVVKTDLRIWGGTKSHLSLKA